MKRLTQKDRVLRHLKDHGSIGPMDALGQYGIYRLADVILRLRKDGYRIQTVEQQSRNRYGEPTRFARYEWE